MTAPRPYLTIVVASRNDDHGGDPLLRTRAMVTRLGRQCRDAHLPAELLLVDWNPPSGRPPLSEAIRWNEIPPPLTCRIVTVPAALHNRIRYSDKLPFFQMIAKNVGIRRASGVFTLATNIDILLDESLFRCIAQRGLDSSRMYRCDRIDIPNEALKHALNGDPPPHSNRLRHHRRAGPRAINESVMRGDRDALRNTIRRFCFELDPSTPTPHLVAPRGAPMDWIHTNACGDFTLLHRDAWHSLRGYPEFEAFSFNIDSVLVYNAHYAGYSESSFLPPACCYHIEHAFGSGWTPEGESRLFDRIGSLGIAIPDWRELTPLIDRMRLHCRATVFNTPSWGLGDYALPETIWFAGDRIQSSAEETDVSPDPIPPARHPVVSLLPEFDLDRLKPPPVRSSSTTRRAPPRYRYGDSRCRILCDTSTVIPRVALKHRMIVRARCGLGPAPQVLKPFNYAGIGILHHLTVLQEDGTPCWSADPGTMAHALTIRSGALGYPLPDGLLLASRAGGPEIELHDFPLPADQPAILELELSLLCARSMFSLHNVMLMVLRLARSLLHRARNVIST